MTKRKSPSSKRTHKAHSPLVPGADKEPSHRMRMMDTYVVFKILPADTPKDQSLLRQLAAACRKAAFFFQQYRQSLASRVRTLDPLLLEDAWAVPTNVEDGSRQTMITELSEMCHISPAQLFGSMITKRLPGGYDPRDLQRFTFDGLMEEMGRWCEHYARPGKRRSRKGTLRWLIAQCHRQLWGDESLGAYPNGNHYDGPFLDLMERILRHIGYEEYHSRDALGQTCVEVLREQKKYREEGLEFLRNRTASKDATK